MMASRSCGNFFDLASEELLNVPRTPRGLPKALCKQLWPLFPYGIPMCPDHGDRFDRQLWQAYVSANKSFADKVMEVVNPEDDFIWIHDHRRRRGLPTFLRKRYNRIKLGFFLHSTFPSPEIYRTLPVRDEKKIAELYEQEENLEQSIVYYERAADLFQSEDVSTSANQCRQKIAQFAAQLEQYQKAIEIYEDIGRRSLNNNLLKCGVKREPS